MLLDETGLGFYKRFVRYVAYEILPCEMDRRWYFYQHRMCPPPVFMAAVTLTQVWGTAERPGSARAEPGASVPVPLVGSDGGWAGWVSTAAASRCPQWGSGLGWKGWVTLAVTGQWPWRTRIEGRGDGCPQL